MHFPHRPDLLTGFPPLPLSHCFVRVNFDLRPDACARRTLADVDKDGRLQGDEFILAMHLVDMAKTGRPLPLTLPQDLVPPSLR